MCWIYEGKQCCSDFPSKLSSSYVAVNICLSDHHRSLLSIPVLKKALYCPFSAISRLWSKTLVDITFFCSHQFKGNDSQSSLSKHHTWQQAVLFISVLFLAAPCSFEDPQLCAETVPETFKFLIIGPATPLFDCIIFFFLLREMWPQQDMNDWKEAILY